MKKLSYLIFFFSCCFLACKNTLEEPEYVCNNVVLEKVDWSYCIINTEYNIWTKCNDSRDSLIMPIKQHIENIQGQIYEEEKDIAYCLIPNSGTKLGSLTPINLPSCFKKNGLKVKFSGDIRTPPRLNEANCGDLFELTQIEISQ